MRVGQGLITRRMWREEEDERGESVEYPCVWNEKQDELLERNLASILWLCNAPPSYNFVHVPQKMLTM